MRKIEARVVQLFICPADRGYNTGNVSSEIVDELMLDWEGIVGDRHHGRMLQAGGRQKDYAAAGTSLLNLRPITIVTLPELHQIAENLGVADVKGADVGANIVLDGPVTLTSFPGGINGVFKFDGGATLYCGGENEPCDGPGRVLAARYQRPELANRFQKAAMHRRGVVALVGTPGVISGKITVGEMVTLCWPSWAEWKQD